MKKKVLLFIMLSTFYSNTFSEVLSKRVIKRGTEEVVTSISMTTDESIGICLQALVNISTQNKWVSINGAWNLRTRLDSPIPDLESCVDIFSDKPVDDTIFVNFFEDSSVIAIPLLIRYVDSVAFVKINLENNPKNVRYGDTLLLKTWVYLKQDLSIIDFCFDSISYVMQKADRSIDTLSELVVNGKNYKSGQNLKQCFKNFSDSVKIVLKDTTLLSNRYILFHVRSHVDSTPIFDFSGVKASGGKRTLPANKKYIVYNDGLIQFNRILTAPAEIKVLNVKGELIHQSMYVPLENTLQQYRLPISLPIGYYLFSLNVNGERSIFPCVIMK